MKRRTLTQILKRMRWSISTILRRVFLARNAPDYRSWLVPYATVAIHRDWPQMSEGTYPEESQVVNTAMWKTLMSIKAASATELTVEDHSASELGSLTAHRRTRLLQSASRLPGVLWSVLIIGGTVTVASATMFGAVSLRLHAVQVLAFALLISLVLVAIADIDRPFQGSVHISSYAFERAQQSMSASF